MSDEAKIVTAYGEIPPDPQCPPHIPGSAMVSTEIAGRWVDAAVNEVKEQMRCRCSCHRNGGAQ